MTIHVGLIEDHPALREGLRLLLAPEGCDVVGTAAGYSDGLEMVARCEPDVIVVDVGLGEQSGISLTRRLVAERPERRVVLYTASSDVETLFDGLDSGARAYALKEGAPEELVEAIRVVSGGGTYVDPRLRPALLSRRSTARQPALSVRERQVLELLAEGLTGEEVAERLTLSAETVKTHVRNAAGKLEARNRVHAIAIALRAGEISPDAQVAAPA